MSTQPQSCGACRWATDWRDCSYYKCGRIGTCEFPFDKIPAWVTYVDGTGDVTPDDGESCPCFERVEGEEKL
jgi:hypothetical protein